MFKIKHEDRLNNFLGVNIIRSKEKDKVWLLQPHLIKSLMQEWGERLKSKRCPVTPGTTGQSFRKVTKEVEEGLVPISKQEHKIYQSMVGKLLYLLKHALSDRFGPNDNPSVVDDTGGLPRYDKSSHRHRARSRGWSRAEAPTDSAT